MKSSSPPGVVAPPALHGDGVTDDTEAIQWYIDHDIPLPAGAEYRVVIAALRLPGDRILTAKRP